MSESNKWTFPWILFVLLKDSAGRLIVLKYLIYLFVKFMLHVRSLFSRYTHKEKTYIYFFNVSRHRNLINRNKGKVGKCWKQRVSHKHSTIQIFSLLCKWGQVWAKPALHMGKEKNTKPGCSLLKPASIWSIVSAKWSRVILILHLYWEVSTKQKQLQKYWICSIMKHIEVWKPHLCQEKKTSQFGKQKLYI